jgi:dihydrofolate reductase
MLSIIVATAENNGIGKGNKIPWHLPRDWKHFSTLTKGHTVIMGRTTYESILEYLKKPLPERTTIVVTRNKDLKTPDCIVAHSLEEALAHAKTNGETFIGGGGAIYRAALPFTDRIYQTIVHTTIDADTFFPTIDEGEWVATTSEFVPKDEKNMYDMTFITYDRRSPLTKTA